MRWLKRKKTEPELPLEPPIRLGNMSNGEFFHEATPMERKIRDEILRQAASTARFNAITNTQRVINHCQVNPTDNLQLQLAIMERIKRMHNCWGFKSYPEWGRMVAAGCSTIPGPASR